MGLSGREIIIIATFGEFSFASAGYGVTHLQHYQSKMVPSTERGISWITLKGLETV